MTEPPPEALPRAELSAGDERRLDRLRRALAEKPGFQLAVLEVPEGPLREAVLARVLAWGGKDGAPPLESITVEPSGDVDQVLLGHKAKAGVVLLGLDDARHPGPWVDRAFGTLNWIRDQLTRALKGPLVLVLSPRGVAKLLGQAPDLASSRAHTCRIGAGDGEPEDDPSESDREDGDSSTRMLHRVSTQEDVFQQLPSSLPEWLAEHLPGDAVLFIVVEAERLLVRAQLPPSVVKCRLRREHVPSGAGAIHAWSQAIRKASALSPHGLLALLLAARSHTGGAPVLDDAIRTVLEPTPASVTERPNARRHRGPSSNRSGTWRSSARDSPGVARALTRLGRRIRALRIQRRLTQAEAAEAARILEPHWNDIETARTNPSVATLVGIARALKVSLSELFEHTDA